jgi:hypothetical protein
MSFFRRRGMDYGNDRLAGDGERTDGFVWKRLDQGRPNLRNDRQRYMILWFLLVILLLVGSLLRNP